MYPEPPADEERFEALLVCHRSGQISADRWAADLIDEPDFAAWL